jgi:hypothetical protein
MSLRLRVLGLFLAVLPALWAFCPCCLGGSSCGGEDAAPCSCCPSGDDVPDRSNPKDCDECAATLARAASQVAPDVALPAMDAATAVAVVAAAPAEPAREVAVVLVRTGGPAPPDPTLAAIRTVVLLA